MTASPVQKPPTQRAFLDLLRTYQQLTAEFCCLFKQYAISEPKYNVLAILREAGSDGLPCLEIAQRMIIRAPDITRLVDKLVMQGLVQRCKSCQDRRVVLVCITEQGLELMERLEAPVLELHEKQLGHLSPEELSLLSELLSKARSSQTPPPRTLVNEPEC